MKALCWHGTNDIRCDSVPDPKIEDGRDVIIKVTSCAICGSDLHLMDGLMPTMKSGDILVHEFMGEVIETGSAHNKFRKGDRIVVPFNINCGECRQCKLGNYSVCQVRVLGEERDLVAVGEPHFIFALIAPEGGDGNEPISCLWATV
jgi:threonine dehydrogenase-like Zn-dependent dehydrogenase